MRQRSLGVSLLVFACGPFAAVAFYWLQRAGLIAGTPYWLLALLLVACSLSNLVTILATAYAHPTVRLHARLAVAAVSTTWVVYAAGWGSIILIGYAVGIADVLRQEGSRAWVPGLLWTGLAMLGGEYAVALGVAPSLLEPAVGHALAFGGFVCMCVVVRTLGVSARAAEDAATRLEEGRAYFHDLVEHAADVIALVSAALRIEYVSPAVGRLLGRAPDECVGATVEEVLGARAAEPFLGLVASLDGATSATGELALDHVDGAERRAEVAVMRRADGSIVVNLHDVTCQRALEAQLRHRATFDTLTSLPNRHATVEQLEQLRAANDVTVLFVDLDGFKDVNDHYGHERGDDVLREMAHRIARSIPAGAIVGRLGGDEFLAVLPDVDVDAATDVARDIIAAIERPYHALEHCTISASVGIAVGAHDEPIDGLLRRADEAMYAAKGSGRGKVHVADLTPARGAVA